MNPDTLKDAIRSKALELGFQSLGFAPVKLDPIEYQRLDDWLEKKHHGNMSYMNKPGIDRCDAHTVMDSAQSVLMVTLDYPPAPLIPDFLLKEGYISSYARGQDYHAVLKDKLSQLGDFIQKVDPQSKQTRPFVDTAPVVERAFSKAAGLGWYGKNTCLIDQGRGSFFFLGGLALDIDVEPDQPVSDHCGNCTRCLDACPTDALISPYQLDARRCISYLTIEHRGSWPEELRALTGPHIYGCDICQTVCPWNRFATADQGTDFQKDLWAPGPLISLFEAALASFKALTRKTAATRVGKKGLLRNLVTAMGNSQDKVFVAELEKALEYDDPAVQDHARWALNRLK
jgi:epoxyqueuosine reductase